MPRKRDDPIIPCKIQPETRRQIEQYADALKVIAPQVGDHGLGPEQFWESGLFHAAVESLRGSKAASMAEKRGFVRDVLDLMVRRRVIDSWKSAGGDDRHDYEVRLVGGRISVIETKGCLDGNNTNIFQRPPHADEFLIWSLCQNAGSDPRHNVWSGIHTRLSAEIMHQRVVIDGLIVWDPVCNSLGRPCPKIAASEGRLTNVGGRMAPPPCIYLFPRTVPDPRSNPTPSVNKLENIGFLAALNAAFGGRAEELTEVHIEARMNGADITRKTSLRRAGVEIRASAFTKIKRARI